MKHTSGLRRLRAVSALLPTLFALSCSGDSPTGGTGGTGATERVPSTLRLSNSELTLGEQESATVSASVLDQKGQVFTTLPAGVSLPGFGFVSASSGNL